MNTYARLRKDLRDQDLRPPCSKAIDPELWTYYKFEVLTLLEESEDFNLILLHPISGEKLEVYSIDFDFE